MNTDRNGKDADGPHLLEPTSRKRPNRSTLPRHHPWQRRKLQVPVSFDAPADVYQFYQFSESNSDWQSPWMPMGARRPRPLPSTQILSSTLATSGTSGSSAPLLQSFYEAMGMTRHQISGVDEEGDASQKIGADVAIAGSPRQDLDNSELSTLSAVQHKRYLKLNNSTDRRTPSDRKTWKQLRALVAVERTLYQTAVACFWAANRDQLFAGFTLPSQSSLGFSSQLLRTHQHLLRPCCQWASSEHQRQNDQLLGAWGAPFASVDDSSTNSQDARRTKFGKYRQVLSLHPTPGARDHLDVQSLDIQVIWDGSLPSSENDVTGRSGAVPVASLPTVGATVLPPKVSSQVEDDDSRVDCWVSDLQGDKKALDLAKHHSATILTTEETLESLLQIPGEYSTRWILPISTYVATEGSTPVMILGGPVAQAYTTPRQCVTHGIEEGLYQQSGAKDGCYAYALWTIPTANGSHRGSGRRSATKVIIRSTIRLLDPGVSIPPRPLKIRAHVEYFTERGREELSRYERSLWVLDQVLWKHHVTTQVARVDTTTGKIVAWQDGSVAHAMAEAEEQPVAASDGQAPKEDLLQGLAHAMQLFQALPTIDLGRRGSRTTSTTSTSDGPLRLLCLPSREVPGNSATSVAPSSQLDLFSVSVHAPVDKDTEPVAVDLYPIIRGAEGVLMHAEAIRQCQRAWKWDDADRIPYTFPVSNTRKIR